MNLTPNSTLLILLPEDPLGAKGTAWSPLAYFLTRKRTLRSLAESLVCRVLPALLLLE